MICAELEKLEAELDDIITDLENPQLAPWQRKELEAAYSRISHRISEHQKRGHQGGPCYEDETQY